MKEDTNSKINVNIASIKRENTVKNPHYLQIKCKKIALSKLHISISSATKSNIGKYRSL